MKRLICWLLGHDDEARGFLQPGEFEIIMKSNDWDLVQRYLKMEPRFVCRRCGRVYE